MSEQIIIKNQHQIEALRKAGRLTAMARAYAGSLVRPGITTKELDRAIFKFITSHGGYPSFYHLYGFRGSACISINDEIIHGVPSNRKLAEGDIVSVDVGACVGDYHLDKNQCVDRGGFHGDCAATFAVGQISEEAQKLIRVTEEAFWKGIANARPGKRVSDISRGVQEHVEANGFSVVREYVGHGVGASVHEAPEVPNYVEAHRRGPDPRLVPGMVIAVEPMVNAGSVYIQDMVMPDGWRVPKTRDGKLAAHYENTILITNGEPEVLTRCGD
jgi:methionyl aminopeptidase